MAEGATYLALAVVMAVSSWLMLQSGKKSGWSVKRDLKNPLAARYLSAALLAGVVSVALLIAAVLEALSVGRAAPANQRPASSSDEVSQRRRSPSSSDVVLDDDDRYNVTLIIDDDEGEEYLAYVVLPDPEPDLGDSAAYCRNKVVPLERGGMCYLFRTAEAFQASDIDLATGSFGRSCWTAVVALSPGEQPASSDIFDDDGVDPIVPGCPA